MNIYQELKARGFIYQETDSAIIEKKLATEKVVFYCGFDPTGSSLHVGHLLPVMAMRMLQKAGHVPTVLVGGATGAIGDPSGRSTARNMLTMDTVAENVEALKAQLARFITLENGEAFFVNNFDWLGQIKLLDFLRDIGSRFSVNRMLAQKSVESRMENGLSFLNSATPSSRDMTSTTSIKSTTALWRSEDRTNGAIWSPEPNSYAECTRKNARQTA